MKIIRYNNTEFYYIIHGYVVDGHLHNRTEVYVGYMWKYSTTKFLWFGKVEKEKKLFDRIYTSALNFESTEHSKKDIEGEMQKAWLKYLEWKARNDRYVEIQKGQLI